VPIVDQLLLFKPCSPLEPQQSHSAFHSRARPIALALAASSLDWLTTFFDIISLRTQELALPKDPYGLARRLRHHSAHLAFGSLGPRGCRSRRTACDNFDSLPAVTYPCYRKRSTPTSKLVPPVFSRPYGPTPHTCFSALYPFPLASCPAPSHHLQGFGQIHWYPRSSIRAYRRQTRRGVEG
jgi:hypothetical protein